MSLNESPFSPFFKEQGFLVLDGGLATELEKRGFDLNHHLWSARLLDSNPEAIADVHRSYLRAGADCIITASYQGSIPGFVKAGYSKSEAISLLERSVDIACDARNEFVSGITVQQGERISPIVAASVGPYGAYLADGSEYRGQYNISVEELADFHEERFEILCRTSADIMACETIPCRRESEVLCDLISKYPQKYFWVSFSCQDLDHLYDRTPLEEVASLFSDIPNVLAIGINCTIPRFISGLIKKLSTIDTQKEIIVYPNSGEFYDATTKTWIGEANPSNFATMAKNWFNNGVRIIGGCCRTGPDHIKQLRSNLQQLTKETGK